MARPLRLEFDGAWYHVMNRGADRRRIFLNAQHRSMFMTLLGQVATIYGIEFHAYCLMETHYHLLIHTPKAGLSRAMRHLDGVYTQRFNRAVERDGPLFRGRYKSIVVGDDHYLRCVSRYIHLNPVEARLVTVPEDYRHSSYRSFLGLEVAPWWLSSATTLRLFDSRDPRASYRSFVEAGIDNETRAFYGKARQGPVFGSEESLVEMEDRAVRSKAGADPERPDFDLLTVPPALDDIGEAICRAFEIELCDLRPAARRCVGLSPARGAFVILGREVGRQTLQSIASWLGYRSYAAASRARARLETAIVDDPDVRRRLDTARRMLCSSDS